MSLFLPGAGPVRTVRASQLAFHWRSSDASVDAVSGQRGNSIVFVNPGTHPGLITGLNGASFEGGTARPRFIADPLQGGVTRLTQQGEFYETAQHVENIVFDSPVNVYPLTFYWKVWPYYAPGWNLVSSANTLLAGGYAGPMFGNSPTADGGMLGFIRRGTDWASIRVKAGVSAGASITEPATVIYPMEALIVLNSNGSHTFSVRDATGAVLGSTTTAANATYMTLTDKWAGNQLLTNGVMGLIAPGGRWNHEVIKIARGAQTFDQMVLLS